MATVTGEVTSYDLPRKLWRVVFEEGYGWPKLTRRERKRRTFATAEQAGRMLDAIERLPSHHVLVGVYTSDLITWEPIDPDTLPRPKAATDDDDTD